MNPDFKTFEYVMKKLEKNQVRNLTSKKYNRLAMLENPELIQVSDYTSNALKILKTETQAILCQVKKIFDHQTSILTLKLSNEERKVENNF